MLYVCFSLLRPDVAMDPSWQHGLNDFYMPYKIQPEHTLNEKVGSPTPSIKPNAPFTDNFLVENTRYDPLTMLSLAASILVILLPESASHSER